MEFGDPIASGNILVREALQSENYVEGQYDGWAFYADGRAVIGDALVRNTITVGDPADPNVAHTTMESAGVYLYPNLPNVDHIDGPGSIEHPTGLNEELLRIGSMVRNVGLGGEDVAIRMIPPDTLTGAKGLIELDFSTALTAGPHTFEITDAQVLCDPMRPLQGFVNGIPNTTSLVPVVVGVAATRIVPPSGQLEIRMEGALFNSVATNRTVVGFKIRNTNALGAIVYDGTVTADVMSRAGALATYTDVSKSRIVTGLTPGMLAWVEMYYYTSAAGTANIQIPTLTVTPLS